MGSYGGMFTYSIHNICQQFISPLHNINADHFMINKYYRVYDAKKTYFTFWRIEKQ